MNGTENSSGWKQFTATAAAITAWRRVKVDSNGLISVCGAADRGIGVVDENVASGGLGTVKLWSAPGTFPMVAAAGVVRGTILYTAANGEVDDTGSVCLGMQALEAATAQGDLIECTEAIGVGGLMSGQESIMQFPINLALVANGDVFTALPLTAGGTITQVEFRVTAAATTSGKATTLTPKIGSTSVTGGVVALTSANCTPIANVVAGTAVTAANVFVAGNTLTIAATSTTAFIEGSGILQVHYIPA